MLKEVSGDILLTGAEAVAHGVAPNDNFASGLALSLRERWPAMYKDFRHYSQTFTPKRVVELGRGRWHPNCESLHSGAGSRPWSQARASNDRKRESFAEGPCQVGRI